MSVLNIVLVEPQIPQNTGNIARTCAATGARLHLVEPMGFKVDNAKLKRAGLDYWHLLDITYYADLNDFFEKNKDGNFFYFSTKATKIYSEVEYPDNCYLVFGKETAGLPEELLFDNKENCVRLPMINDSSARSLNLSNSLAVGAYEVLIQWKFPELLTKGKLTKFDWTE
jgi:tRNA (cytidine/uridine-2'-O-)-methyltransferase